MKFDSYLASIHGYLCADGYVIKNPKSQKHRYYHIALRNTNNVLLGDFQKKFYNKFRIKPHITKDGRCRIQSKEIFSFLTKEFSYYSNSWKLPSMSKKNLKFWLRAFFDCESWVECQKAKSRAIRLDCKNSQGIRKIKSALEKFSIKSSIKTRRNDMMRLNICGLNNLKKFRNCIGFLHPNKKTVLEKAINSYADYNWDIPSTHRELLEFITTKGKIRNSRNEIRLTTILKRNVVQLQKALNRFAINSNIHGPWTNGYGSRYYCLTLKKEVCNETRNQEA